MHKDTFTVSYVTIVNDKPEGLIRDNYGLTHPVENRSFSDASMTTTETETTPATLCQNLELNYSTHTRCRVFLTHP